MAKAKSSTAPLGDRVMESGQLDALIKTLRRRKFEVIAPRVRDGDINLESIQNADALPFGWVETQGPGALRIEPAKNPAYFDFTHGSASWKRYLFPPREKLFSVQRHDKGFDVHPENAGPKYAFIGVRACELAAIGIQDKVFKTGDFLNDGYARRRDQAFIVAVNCRRAGGTCFCASTDTGPEVQAGADLILTELTGKDAHGFLVHAASLAGEKVLSALETRPADKKDVKAAKRAIAKAAKGQSRTLPRDARDVLAKNPRHAHWEDVAKRCLNCANCTLVCPTCFCNTVQDETSLDGTQAERWRQWDSCFTLDFSYIHGGALRRDPAHRYRQWITHKLSHWFEQFGTSGCVGCGRCITWCPVGIDITAEVRALGAGQNEGS